MMLYYSAIVSAVLTSTQERKMGKFQITSKAGVDFGIYEGDTEEEAFSAMIADGGDGEDDAGRSTAGAAQDWIIHAVESRGMSKRVNLNGKTIDFDAAVNLMDDDIREDLHNKMAPCTDQEFLDAYAKAHADKYDGEEFEVA